VHQPNRAARRAACRPVTEPTLMYQHRTARPHTSIALLLGLVVVLAVGLIFVQTQRLLDYQRTEEAAQLSQIVVQAQAIGEPIAQLCAGSKGPTVARELADTRTPDGQGVCPAAVQLQQQPRLPPSPSTVPSTRPPNAYEVQRMIDEELARRSLVPIPPALTTPPTSPALPPSPPATIPTAPVPTTVVRPTWSAPPAPTTVTRSVPRSHRATAAPTPTATVTGTSAPTTVVTRLPPMATVTQQPPATVTQTPPTTVTQPAPATVTTTATAAPVPQPEAPSQGVLPAVGDTVSGLVSGLLGVLAAWASSLSGRFR
jgi:hypothetical protein